MISNKLLFLLYQFTLSLVVVLGNVAGLSCFAWYYYFSTHTDVYDKNIVFTHTHTHTHTAFSL